MTETYGAALLVEEMELAASLFASLRRQGPRGRPRCADPLDGAAAHLHRTSARRRPRHRTGAAADAQRPARGARRAAAVRRHAAAAEPVAVARAERRRRSAKAAAKIRSNRRERLRPKFQLALLGWIKGGDAARHLETLAKVAAALENAATRDDMYQLWWVVGGVLESLQNGGLETSVALKRLLGQTDRQIKFVIDEGLLSLRQVPGRRSDEQPALLRCAVEHGRASASARSARRSICPSLLPGDEQVEHAREALSAPSAKLMETVGSAIKEDLRSRQGRARHLRPHGHEQVVRARAPARAAEEDQRYARRARSRRAAQRHRRRDRSPQGRRRAATAIANDQIILDIASTLLRVEDRLDQQLMHVTTVPEASRKAGPKRNRRSRSEDYTAGCRVGDARVHHQPRPHQGDDQPEHRVPGAVIRDSTVCRR